MTDERMDQTFHELQAELRLTPSPEFAAKVRARTAEAPARGWFAGWRLAAASVTVLGCAVLAVVMWSGGGPISGAASVPVVARLESPPPVIVGRPAPRAVTTVPGGRDRVVRPAVVAARLAARSGPEVLVPPDERLALARLLVALKDGRAVVPAAESAFDEETGELKPLAAIAPIVVAPLSTAANGGGNERRER
jgi:hypothetical protein